ncbi:membrane protein [Streptomyces spiralis]|uniref:Membrane protein n=1 Tax=Streptomyces spiralis TaxID=66376 RepID=A0A918ZN19_9ACTN|nr:membrane protein [Streptomyces spiralis]
MTSWKWTLNRAAVLRSVAGMNATASRGALLAALACVLVGGSFTANSVLGHYPYAGGQFLRYGLACLLLLPLARRGAAARLRRLGPRHWVRLALLAAVGMVGFNLAVLAAERTAEPAVPGVFVGCAPVVVAVLVPVLEGRRPRRVVLYGAWLVAAGAFTVQGWGRTDGTGIAFSACALAGEVGFAVLATPVLRPLGPRLLSAVVCGVASLEAAVAGICLDGTAWLRRPDTDEAVALLWQAAVVTVVGFVCWYMGMQRIGAERATLFSGLIPVAAACTAPLVGTGSYGVAQAVGSALVGTGVALGSGALERAGRRSAAAVEEHARDERRVVVHRDVSAAGQPHQPGARDHLLGTHPLPADQQPVPGAPGHGDRYPGDVVGELDVDARAEGLFEAGGLRQGERLGDHGLG